MMSKESFQKEQEKIKRLTTALEVKMKDLALSRSAKIKEYVQLSNPGQRGRIIGFSFNRETLQMQYILDYYEGTCKKNFLQEMLWSDAPLQLFKNYKRIWEESERERKKKEEIELRNALVRKYPLNGDSL